MTVTFFITLTIFFVEKVCFSKMCGRDMLVAVLARHVCRLVDQRRIYQISDTTDYGKVVNLSQQLLLYHCGKTAN